VIAVDTNVLVYAHRRDSEFHTLAAEAIQRLAGHSEVWAIPWPCVHEFLSVATNPRIFKLPTPLETAIAQVEIWQESPSLRFIGEHTRYWENLSVILRHGNITGSKVHDARITAICKAHGVRELWTADRDFSRIAGIGIRNPLLTN